MGIARISQTNFNRGEIDPNLIGRVSLETYGSALKKARNVIVNNQGPVERRPGTYFRADLGAESRLESFIFSGDQEYIFALTQVLQFFYPPLSDHCPCSALRSFYLLFLKIQSLLI